MQRTVVGYGSDDHNRRTYKIRVAKVGCIITRTKGHVKAIAPTAEDCLQKEISKKKYQVTDKFNELICKHEHSRGTERNGSGMVKGTPTSKPHTLLSPRSADHNPIRDNGSKADKHMLPSNTSS